MSLIALEDARSRVMIAPATGAALAGFEARTKAGTVPVLRGWDGVTDAPFAQACNILVPFSNRIHGGGFRHDGVFHPVAPNHPGAPVPIHGDAFQRAWGVTSHGPTDITLTLPEGAIGPWRYRAEATYTLEDGALRSEVTITNTGPALPFGGGFHPWFPRRPDTRLGFHAESVRAEAASDPQGDPQPLSALPDRDFRTARPLPDDLIDHGFDGWRGTARIDQPGLGIAVTVASDMGCAIVFSPGVHADFFCFEPVMHGVDAINAPGHPGMTVLETGESLDFRMTITGRPCPEPLRLAERGLEPIGLHGVPVHGVGQFRPGVDVMLGRKKVPEPLGNFRSGQHVDPDLDHRDDRNPAHAGRDVGRARLHQPVRSAEGRRPFEEGDRVAGILQVDQPGPGPAAAGYRQGVLLGREPHRAAIVDPGQPDRRSRVASPRQLRPQHVVEGRSRPERAGYRVVDHPDRGIGLLGPVGAKAQPVQIEPGARILGQAAPVLMHHLDQGAGGIRPAGPARRTGPRGSSGTNTASPQALYRPGA